MVTGGGFRAADLTNLYKGIPEVDENFGADGKRKFFRIISIRVDDLLISGSDGFTEYIYWEMDGGLTLISMMGIKRPT